MRGVHDHCPYMPVTEVDPNGAPGVEIQRQESVGSSTAPSHHDIGLDGESPGDEFADDAAGGRPSPPPARRRPLQVLFSVSKGLLGLMVTAILDDGLITLIDPVASHWPEFAAGAKESITLRELFAHHAGLPAFAAPTTYERLADWRRYVDDLAAQAPMRPPGYRIGYHH